MYKSKLGVLERGRVTLLIMLSMVVIGCKQSVDLEIPTGQQTKKLKKCGNKTIQVTSMSAHLSSLEHLSV